MNEYKKNEFETQKGKAERSEWRKLINFIVAIITLYLLLNYNILEYTGYIAGFILIMVWGGVVDYIVKKILIWWNK